MKEGNVWAPVQAGILGLHLQNGCKKEILRDKSVHTAAGIYCWCISKHCQILCFHYLCIIFSWFSVHHNLIVLWGFPQKKYKYIYKNKNNPWGLLLVLTQTGLESYLTSPPAKESARNPESRARALGASLPNAPVNQPCPSAASVRLCSKMLHVCCVQNWFFWHFTAILVRLCQPG